MLGIRDIARLLDNRADQYDSLSERQFAAMIANLKGAKIATILARTVPSGFRKKNNPFYGNCYKIQKVNVIINPSDAGYTDSVNRQRVKEGKEPTFQADVRAFGTKLTKKPVIAHITKEGDAKFYLWVKTQKVVTHHYIDSQGNILPLDEVEQFIPIKNESVRQGTDVPTIVRNFTMENIIGIIIDKRSYIIE